MSIIISDYKKCDELKEEVIRQLREVEAEQKHLSVSKRKSKWYHKRKSPASSTPLESDVDPLKSCYPIYPLP